MSASDEIRLVQFRQEKYDCMRLRRGEPPFFEFKLNDAERIVGVHHYWTTDLPDRETVDHHIIVWIEARF